MEFLFGLTIMGFLVLVSLLVNRQLIRIHRALTFILPFIISVLGLLMFMLVFIAPEVPHGWIIFIASFAFFYAGILVFILSFVLKR